MVFFVEKGVVAGIELRSMNIENEAFSHWAKTDVCFSHAALSRRSIYT
jgi:hypothetical protein